MSIRIMSEVFSNQDRWLKGTRRLILLVLADNANDDGACWPSINTISRKSNTSRRFVINILKELEERHYIIRTQRAVDGVNISTYYEITLDKARSADVDTKHSDAVSTKVVSQIALKPSVNHQFKPSLMREEENQNLSPLLEEKQDEQCAELPLAVTPPPIKRTTAQEWNERKDGVLAEVIANASKYRDADALNKYPEDTRGVVEQVCELWHLKATSRKTELGYWIEGSRGIIEACGELSYHDVLARLHADYERYMDSHGGVAPYTVASPNSLVKAVRATAGVMRSEQERIAVASNGGQVQVGKVIQLDTGGTIILPKGSEKDYW